MTDIQHYGGGGGLVPSRPARVAARAVSRNTMAAQVRVSAVDAEADITTAKIENVTMVTATAMQSVARVAQVQRQLEQLVPEVAGRLAYLGDDHALGMGELLTDLRHAMRRM